ncbi:MAG: hypothetical protein AAF975_09665, partial [Spirochaetota bacterium]
MARAFGLEAQGVGTYDHAFVSVILGDRRHIDVETTSEYGFDPGQKKEFFDTFTSTTGLVYVPKQQYAKRATLSDAEFIGLILQNRLYILNQYNKNFRVLEQMIPLAADLATLTQSDQDVQNFFSMVSQYSFQLSEEGRVSEAFRYTDMVLQTYGSRESIVKVRNAIAYNDVFRLIGAKNFREADKRLLRYRSANLLDREAYQTLSRNSKRAKLEGLVNNPEVPFAEKLAAVEDVAQEDVLALSKLQEVYQVVYKNEIYSLLRNHLFSQAGDLLNSYPQKFFNRSFYRKMLSDIEETYVVDVYNKAVKVIKQGDYQKAKRLLGAGLRSYPNNSRLLQLSSKLQQF